MEFAGNPVPFPLPWREPALEPPPPARPVAPTAAIGGVRVEECDFVGMLAHEPAWSDLCGRVLEPNVFLDPAFALPLTQHAAHRLRPRFILAWDTAGRRLLGLLPLTPAPGAWSPGAGLAHAHTDPYVPLGVPLLDRIEGLAAFKAMLAWMARRRPHQTGLVLTAVPVAGAFYAALTAASRREGRALTALAHYSRAVLPHAEAGRAPGPAAAAPLLLPAVGRRGKELRRQRRRLEERGRVIYSSARTPRAIAEALERFLVLEHQGWKGGSGSSLLSEPARATFARAMTRLMAHAGRCRVDALELDGRPVAMGIVLMAGKRAHFWKTAFDESVASLSPGVQFTCELAARLREDDGIALTDSCAIPDHPMIERLWPDRMALTDFAVALRPDADTAGFETAVRNETLRRRLRAALKRLVRERPRVHPTA